MRRTLDHAARASDINEHLPALYHLVLESRGAVVVELGVRTGESTVALLEGVHTTGGRLWSVDVDPCDKARRMIEGYGLSSRWDFRVADDLDFAAKWDRALPMDLVFVDTSHLYEHTAKEIEAFEPLLRPGGIMVFHDTHSFPDGVLRPVREFLAARPGYRFENRTNCNGLGIMRKPGAPSGGAR